MEMLTEPPKNRIHAALNSVFPWMKEQRGKKEVKFLHEVTVSNSHSLFTHTWMTSVRDLKPRNLHPVSSYTTIFLRDKQTKDGIFLPSLTASSQK